MAHVVQIKSEVKMEEEPIYDVKKEELNFDKRTPVKGLTKSKKRISEKNED